MSETTQFVKESLLKEYGENTLGRKWLNELFDELTYLKSELSAEREKHRWISVEERLPKSNILVNVSYRLKSGLRVRQSAIYIAPKTILAEDFLSDDIDCSDAEEYDEENDCYWVVEGWWEDSFESDMNYKISREITHWQPLPEPPEREE